MSPPFASNTTLLPSCSDTSNCPAKSRICPPEPPPAVLEVLCAGSTDTGPPCKPEAFKFTESSNSNVWPADTQIIPPPADRVGCPEQRSGRDCPCAAPDALCFPVHPPPEAPAVGRTDVLDTKPSSGWSAMPGSISQCNSALFPLSLHPWPPLATCEPPPAPIWSGSFIGMPPAPGPFPAGQPRPLTSSLVPFMVMFSLEQSITDAARNSMANKLMSLVATTKKSNFTSGSSTNIMPSKSE
mmetsp:Transcript_53003/g.113181  ORF Transcript_53003/g.113181 Transcript_53003/m.113181 type:complete len:241 (-) Transcript_53003:463-1185(-)